MIKAEADRTDVVDRMQKAHKNLQEAAKKKAEADEAASPSPGKKDHPGLEPTPVEEPPAKQPEG